MTGGSTTGIWFGESDELLEDFDETFGETEAQWSRSEEIKQAMRLHLAVSDVLDQHDLAFRTEQEKRMWVRQALLDKIRSEASPNPE